MTLTGTVRPHQGFVIRPGQNSDGTRRSAPATVFFVVLDKPFCAQITGGRVVVPPVDVREIDAQGPEPERKLPDLRPWVGKRVALTGQLQWRADEADGQTDPFLVLANPRVQAAP